MLTGFNTDIEHDGVVYHVQTEDKGLDSPLILSLVYSGGEILASKRSRYEDLITTGFDEEVLAGRLKRQHRLICAAINAGRLEELKRMGTRTETDEGAGKVAAATLPLIEAHAATEFADAPASEVSESETAVETLEALTVDETPTDRAADEEEAAAPGGRPRARSRQSAYTVHDSRRQSPVAGISETKTGVVLAILDEDEFRAGESFTIRVLLADGSGKTEQPLGGVTVSVKILGAAFRPQIYSVKTERDGVASVNATMPDFSSGRAAVLIRAVVNGKTVELRRVIHPAELLGQ